MDLQQLEVVSLAWSPDATRLGLLERNQNAAFHPGEWHIVDGPGRSVFRSGGINTYQTSFMMRWSQDSQRAVYAINVGTDGPDLLRSVTRDGAGQVGLSNLAADRFQPFDLAAGSLR